MSESDPVRRRDVLVSLASAALDAAEADAATTDLIFLDEWQSTLRTRDSATQPQSTPPNAGAQKKSWLSSTLNRLGLPDVYEMLRRKHSPGPTTPPATKRKPAPTTSPSAATAVPSSSAHPRPQEDAVKKLIDSNRDVYDILLNHPFPRALGNGRASLDGFRYYMIQDTFYLEICARIKMIQGGYGPIDGVRHFGKRHESSLSYVDETKKALITMLGVPEDVIENTPLDECLHESEKYYKTSLQNHDAYFAYYIVLLPCILSYWEISKRLMDDKSTVRDVVYHRAWTETNHDSSSADKYKEFINGNIPKGGVDRWSDVFRTACRLEINVFNTGLRHPTPFQIVPKGTYSIRYSSSAQSIVLANQNVESLLRPPFDKSLGAYLPSDAGSSVVGVNKKGGNNEKWHVAATKDGYTFQNVGTGHYLGISTALNQKECRILQAVVKPYYWWINPVPGQRSKGSSYQYYQIHETVNLLYTLHAGIKLVNKIKVDFTPVISRNNVEKSRYQVWSFELERPDEESPNIQDPHKARQDITKELAAKKRAEAIKEYEKFLRKEFEADERFREERSKEIGLDLLKEAGTDITVTSKEGMKEKMANLFEKYDRVLGDALDAIEQQRREKNKKKRHKLLEETQKVTDSEGIRKMAELFKNYERKLQTEFQAVDLVRKDQNKGMREMLLEEARKGIDEMDAGEVTKFLAGLVEKYEGMLQRDVEDGGQARMMYDMEVRQDLLAEV